MNQHVHPALIAAAAAGHAPVVKLLLDGKVFDVNRTSEVSPREILWYWMTLSVMNRDLQS
jgi:hypothetical protein